MQQVDAKMLKMAVRAHMHSPRNADMQLTPIAVGVVKDRTSWWVMGLY
jgi:hypothetical protein